MMEEKVINMELKFFFVRKYSENRTIASHSHDVHEFVYYFDGAGTTMMDEMEHQFNKDSFAIIAPNVVHNETHVGRGHIMAIGFQMSAQTDSIISTVYHGFDPNIYALVQKIKTEFIQKNDFYESMISTLLEELVLHIKRMQAINSTSQPTRQHDLGYAISYMNEYFMTDVDLDELAQSSGYCTDHFRVLFKQATGQTPKSFIMSKKLAYAKKLLTDTSIPLHDISKNLGFEYYSRFSAFFSKRLGLSPLQYRKRTFSGKTES
jgi:AraC-like DNA-binding protein